ncbi:rve domain-containing protein [Artemisia annua]|uniref:Rve domain-containing protein n=1 Tax=Artemisia annua TaxID=35608 RepID=A0A2U1MN37_ARTAN|nr:rve domain-containing protein [Artemisia annua]
MGPHTWLGSDGQAVELCLATNTRSVKRRVIDDRAGLSFVNVATTEKNQRADALSKLVALTLEHFGKEVLVEVINEKSILQPAEVSHVETDDTWMTPGILRATTSPYPSQANGQAEEYKTCWVDELSSELWAHRNTPKESTGETPFSLVYGIEAMISVEMLIQTEIFAMVNEDENKDSLRLDLALAEEKHDLAAIRLAHSKNKMEKYYKKRVRLVSFKPSDHVMHRNKVSEAGCQGKLAPNWEGLYIIRQPNDNGSYLLTTPEGVDIRLTWSPGFQHVGQEVAKEPEIKKEPTNEPTHLFPTV